MEKIRIEITQKKRALQTMLADVRKLRREIAVLESDYEIAENEYLFGGSAEHEN